MSRKFTSLLPGERSSLSKEDLKLCKEIALLHNFQGLVANSILIQGWASDKQMKIIKGIIDCTSHINTNFSSVDYDEEDYYITDYDLCIGAHGD